MSDLVLERGRAGRLAHKDQFTREEKDGLRDDVAYGEAEDLGNGWYFVPTSNVRTIESGDYDEPVGDFEEEQELDKDPTVVDEEDGDEPTLSDLEALTVAQLKDLADKEALDVSDLKLKADLIGRLAAHFGVQI